MRFRSREPSKSDTSVFADLSGAVGFSRHLTWKKAILATSLLIVTGLIVGGFRSKWFTPAIEVPVPSNFDDLDPQLRAYVTEKITWVRQRPRDSQRQSTLGMVYASNELWAEALLAFQNAARLNPDEPLAHLYVAVSTQELGQFEQALQLFRQLTRRFPDFPQGFYRLAEASLRTGDLAEAQKAFERLVELAPREWRGFAGLGDIYLRRGDLVAAANQLEKAIQMDPQAKNAHHLLGLAYRGVGRLAEAELQLGLGLDGQSYPMPDPWGETAHQHMKLLPDQVEAAQYYSQADDPGKAIEILEAALKFHPTNVSLMNCLASVYNRSGEPRRARAILLTSLRIDNLNLPAHKAMSYTCLALSENEQALAWAEKSVALAPLAAQAHLSRADALLALGRDSEALAAFEVASRCEPKSGEIRLQIGDVYLRNLKRPEEALQQYKAACELEPTLVSAHVRLAQMHIENGTTNEARAAIEIVKKLEPSSPAIPILENGLRQVNPR